MGKASFIFVPEVVRSIGELSLVSESITAIALQKICIPLLEVLSEVNLS